MTLLWLVKVMLCFAIKKNPQLLPLVKVVIVLTMDYGVMVAQQFLELFDKVRILVVQLTL